LKVLSDKIIDGTNEFQFSEILAYFNESKYKKEIPMKSSFLAKIIESLEEYVLIERVTTEKYAEACFTLQPLVRKYIEVDPAGYVSEGLNICSNS
jgi:hypothetical protein